MKLALSLWLGVVVTAAAAARAPIVLHLEDFATLPITGSATGTGTMGSLARVNVMREEPGGGRLFVSDLNGPLYILDKRTKAFTTYLNFNGRDGRGGLFKKFTYTIGLAAGLISFQFDPDYRRNGKLYTIHLEEIGLPAPPLPDATSAPGLRIAGYEVTRAVKTPGLVDREAVVIQWTDTDLSNTTFEGTARELLRVEHNTRIHPMGDLIFNPTARAGDADWQVLYIACGDSGSGELRNLMRMNPQRLDTLVGKILRIVPDLSMHTGVSIVSENGRYRVPRDNPFVSVPGARAEVWSVGLRNPHRLTWDVDPADRTKHHLIASSIGLHAWETVYFVRRGANYGYSDREGNQRMTDENRMIDLPSPDEIPVRVSETVTRGSIAPAYPVIQYPHAAETGGDAIAGGFVYRGTRLPALRGKFIFGDISTGKVWSAALADMLRADDGDPATLASFEPVRIKWRAPGASGADVYPTMYPVVLAAYRARGGADPDMPGGARVSGSGRADIRFAVDGAGELYVISKNDGMIRAVAGVD